MAIIVAGGTSRRMGGSAKVDLMVGGRRVLDRVIAACDGWSIVLVGPPQLAARGLLHTQERPAYGGPVAGLRAGVAAMDSRRGPVTPPGIVATLAGDQPFLDAPGLAALASALEFAQASAVASAEAGGSGGGAAPGSASDQLPEVAAYADDSGAIQYLCAVWHADALRNRLAQAGSSMRSMYADARVLVVADPRGVARDVDTPADFEAACAALGDPEWSDPKLGGPALGGPALGD